MITTVQEFLRVLAAAVTPWIVLAPWEAGVRIRFGRGAQVLRPGFNWLVPGVDRISVQTTRLRVCQLQVQTLSTRSGRTLMLCATVGYAIGDIARLYNTLHHADDTIKAIVSAAVAEAVRALDDPSPGEVAEAAARGAERLRDFGLKDISEALTDFAFVRCYRLVSDQKWGVSGDSLATATFAPSQVTR